MWAGRSPVMSFDCFAERPDAEQARHSRPLQAPAEKRTMTAIALVILSLLAVYVVFQAVSRSAPETKEEEVEVGLFLAKIRRRRSDLSPALSSEDKVSPTLRVDRSSCGRRARRYGPSRNLAGPMDWHAWHDLYDYPDSGLKQRLALVQSQVRVALHRLPAGPIKVISMCAGQGRDLIGGVAGHKRAGDVQARLVELDPRNAVVARMAAREANLTGIDVFMGDGSLTHAYAGAIPADIVLVCGVFGNVSMSDIRHTIACLPQLCAKDAMVIWTRHRLESDVTPTIRRWFTESGFQELSFEADRSGRFAVGMQRFADETVDLREGERMFTFVGRWPKGLDG